MSILLVDDDPGILETLVDIFEDMGYHTETASTGSQALQKVQQRFFNLALLDIRLPDMQGTELLSQARRLRPDMACIMATGNASLPSAVDSLNEGAYAYLQKPIEVPHVKATVRRALEQQRLEFVNRRLLSQLQALGDITDAALATLELDPLLARLLEKFSAYHQADGAAIYLLDPSTGVLNPRMAVGTSEPAVRPVAVGVGLVGRAVQDGQPVAAHGEELAAEDLVRDGVREALAAPLRSRNALIGAVRLDRTRARPFDQEELDLLRLFADRAGVLIDNARLYHEERLLRNEAQALRDLARELVDRIGLDDRLELISHHLMSIADVTRCVIWLMTRNGLACAAAAGVTAEQERVLRRNELLVEEMSPELRGILDTGQPSILHEVRTSELLPGEALADWGVQSALLLPLRFEGRAIGLVSLDAPFQRRDFQERQVRQATIVALMSAGAIQQAKTIQEERDMARTLAESFLSRSPRRQDLQVASRFRPASEVALVGGDYFDFIQLDEHRLGIVIGDVCGKGLAAAIYTAQAKYMLLAYALENSSPQWVISRLNRALYNQMSEECMFITMVYGVLDLAANTFTYTNAAHPPPILYQPRSGQTLDLMPTGGMVGALEEMEFTENTVTLEPGAVLAMFTDGVTEARTDQKMLENEGVREVVQEHAGEHAEAIATAILDRAQQFASGVLRDDVAIVILKNE